MKRNDDMLTDSKRKWVWSALAVVTGVIALLRTDRSTEIIAAIFIGGAVVAWLDHINFLTTFNKVIMRAIVAALIISIISYGAMHFTNK
jgi:uncharacterized membrane protein